MLSKIILIKITSTYVHIYYILLIGTVGHTGMWKNLLRMDHDLFWEILQRIMPHIYRHDTVMRQAIQPGERLMLTLRYFATGKLYNYNLCTYICK